MICSETPAAFTGDIASLPLFQGMEAELLHGMMTSARLARYDKGAVFLTQGQPVTRYYLLLDGWCGASKGNQNGQESILQIFGHGDFLPEPEGDTINMIRSLLNLQALTAVRLLMMSPHIVRNALERSKIFAANMRAASVRRGHELRDHIEQLTLHSAEERVGRFLLQMRLKAGIDGDEIVLPFDKSLIASYLGIKPETFSRALQSLKKEGFIVGRNRLQMPDRAALCDYCDTFAARDCRHASTEDCPDPVSSAAATP